MSAGPEVMDGTLAQITRALAMTGDVVAGLTSDQWADPTPCPDWDVSDLLNHVVGGMRIFAAELTDEPAGRAHGADWLGDDPVAAYRAAAEADSAAWRRPDAVGRTVQLVFGPLPAPAAAIIHLTEIVVHGVDLAVATGQCALVDDALCQDLLDLMGVMGGVDAYRVPGIFGRARPVAPDAPAHLRLLAYLGRRVEPSGG